MGKGRHDQAAGLPLGCGPPRSPKQPAQPAGLSQGAGGLELAVRTQAAGSKGHLSHTEGGSQASRRASHSGFSPREQERPLRWAGPVWPLIESIELGSWSGVDSRAPALPLLASHSSCFKQPAGPGADRLARGHQAARLSRPSHLSSAPWRLSQSPDFGDSREGKSGCF